MQNISQVTDENGEASATLKLPQDFQNQDIVVTVSANSFEAAVKVTALGSTLEVTGPETLVLGDKAELVHESGGRQWRTYCQPDGVRDIGCR